MCDSVFDLCPDCGGRGTTAMVGIVVGCGVCGGRDVVYSLFVDESMRRRGVGSRLMKVALSEYPSLSGQASNMGSIMFNYQLGFRPTNNPHASLVETIEMFKKSPESLNITHIPEEDVR